LRWLQTKLVIDNTKLKVSAFLNGDSIKTRESKNEITVTLDLTHEKHLLILKVVVPKGTLIKFNSFLENKESFKNERINISLTPKHKVNTKNILNIKNVREIKMSPDGKRVAVSLSQTEKETGKDQKWVEILNSATGRIVFSSRNFGTINNLKWLNHSHGFTYTKTKDEKTAIFKYDVMSNRQQCIIKNIKNFFSYWWANDNSFLIYSTFDAGENEKEYKYIKEIPERSAFPENRYSLFIFYPAGSVTHKISSETQNFRTAVISPDSRKVLLIRAESDYKNRPYFKNCVYLFDLKSLTIKKLLESNVINTFTWAPDSKRLLLLGGPSAFNGKGRNLEKGKIPNEYDTQAYIYDLNTKRVEAISKSFFPSINSASWSSSHNNIYFTTTDQSYIRIFKYSLGKKSYKKMNTMVDVVRRVDFARHKNTAVIWGSGVTSPYRLYKLNLSTNRISLLKDYNRQAFQYVNFGKYENWNYKTRDGKTIIGRIYYPVDFNKNKKYPCIVYYYGGTSPVTRDFGGRYPKNWYAANGYIVYVLQPTGATGFGQDFSAVHVNDWGEVTSEEIITAVKELTRTHSNIDPARIGAMGASYGGFLTQYLATKTDIFAAYISHAGISSLSSYWGVGDWGYTYSGYATANSFPWNRKDIYVGHSPLFMADRIEKPILLLHGDTDNNVPPGESYQMFAALKLLGKEVALITFPGQRHFILEYKKRLRWMRSIIAWWDKYLKNQPEHWDHMYKR
jgi:dipeptidyl aminopeptidase/acylaminoacyl peptidase